MKGKFNANSLEEKRLLLEEVYSVNDLSTIDSLFQQILDRYVVENTTAYSLKGIQRYKNIKDVHDKKFESMLIKIEKILDKTFNLKSRIAVDISRPNSLSYGACIFLTKEEAKGIAEEAIKDKETGYKFIKRREANMYIEEGFLKLCKFRGLTGRHITAVILHEIGHKVYLPVQKKLNAEGKIIELVIAGISIPSTILSLISPIPAIAALIMVSYVYSSTLVSIRYYSKSEAWSDKFAVKYGYGKEIYETMAEFEMVMSGKIKKDRNIFTWISNQFSATYLRRQLIKRELIKEMNDPENGEEMRKAIKEILKQIDNIEK